MIIYEIRAEGDSYSSLEGITKAEREKFARFFLESFSTGWKTTKVEILKSHLDGDFWGLSGGSILAVTEYARKFLIKVLGEKVELLPLFAPKTKTNFYAMNVLNYKNILDEENSEIIRFPDNRILMVTKYVFMDRLQQLPLLFKLENDKLGTLFCTGEFKKIIENNKLTGLEFKEIWHQL